MSIRYPLNIHMDMTVDEMYELRLSLTKKLRNEKKGRTTTEEVLQDWTSDFGTTEEENALLCELSSCEVRIQLLEELLDQLEVAFEAAKVQENRVWRRSKKLQETSRSF